MTPKWCQTTQDLWTAVGNKIHDLQQLMYTIQLPENPSALQTVYVVSLLNSASSFQVEMMRLAILCVKDARDSSETDAS